MALNVRTLFRFPEEGRHFELFRKMVISRRWVGEYRIAQHNRKCRVCGALLATNTKYLNLSLAEIDRRRTLHWDKYKICPACEVRMWYHAGKPDRYYGVDTDRGKGETS